MRGSFVGAAILLASSYAQAGDVAELRVIGDAGAVLQRDDGARWDDICTSPCTATVPRGARYRIGGTNVHASQPFDLLPTGRVTLVVSKAKQSSHVIGWTLGIVGGAFIVGGAGAIVASLVCAPTTCTNSQPVITASGIAAIVLGGIMLVSGTMLVTQNTSSVVVQNPEMDLSTRRALPTLTPLLYVPIVKLTF